MKRVMSLALLATLALAVTSPGLQAQKKPKIKPTVTFARTWDAAVEEARLLNVPMVVHNHGFY